MSELEFDFVVIGGGIVGSWTAKELKSHGKVLLLEQFRLPHTRGSSHGQSRIIRSGYAEDYFAEMMNPAFKMWRQAEAEMDEKLIETTGLLCIADSADNEELKKSVENMKRFCPESLLELTAKDVQSKYPTTLTYPETTGFLFDKSAGAIFASKAVETIQKWFRNLGGIIWDCCAVSNIVPNENGKVIVSTAKGDVSAKNVVVCTGAWTQKLLKDLMPSLPLEPQTVKVCYCKEKETRAYSASSGFPITLSLTNPNVYTLPVLEYPGLVKVCVHAGVPADPDKRDKAPENLEFTKLFKSCIKDHFPLLDEEPSVVETCMYTCTPDKAFIIDYLPGHRNIVLGVGFSGTGFKTSPVVGRLLSELARGEDPFLDISPYRLSRFTTNK